MLINPAKMLFLVTLVMGTLISISSNSWFGVWMGLEINLLSFIPLMTNYKNILSTEASLKYFLIQAFASAILLFSIILLYIFTQMHQKPFFTLDLIISSALLLKMGAAPFHFWFPGTMEGLNWFNCFTLMTWQKIAPLMLLSYLIQLNAFTIIVILSSVMVGSIGGLNQTSLRKLMAYSSINHLGWMIGGMLTGENVWEIYFMIYSFLSLSIIYIFMSLQIFHINQNFLTLNNNHMMKFCLFMLLLSLGGLPPFLGFLPKWIIIQTMAELNLLFLITFMAVTTLITLFYYLRLTFTAFLLSNSELKWNLSSPISWTKLTTLLSLTSISTLGLAISSMMFSII
uniref:NADH-ubiquinone oxidoreductase chain 2 n=1 Tax=Hexacentrus japonicus TaxID=441225 RepID=A0A1Q1MP14_9ORTH|nr:NADH dehydrogenase subunit 2 [Hexacentrus japonicus]AQM39824.1 NADH dehydrogenase subunit 2 [Hexacentrus japonicus]